MNIFTILLMRLIAFVLVSYFSVSTDFAVLLTSDPETVGAINVAISAGVVMLGEVISKKLGVTPAKILMGLGNKYATRLAEKLTIQKPSE